MRLHRWGLTLGLLGFACSKNSALPEPLPTMATEDLAPALAACETARADIESEARSVSSTLNTRTAERDALQTEKQTLEDDVGALRISEQQCIEERDACLAPPADIADRLAQIPGLTVRELSEAVPDTRAFLLTLRQPVDHQNPEGASFHQRMVLMHRSDTAPMNFVTTGYGLLGPPEFWAQHEMELTLLTQSNQLVLEHRYFEGSIPRTHRGVSWAELTVEQSAGDSHRVVEVLKPVYSGAWLGSGVSKGGMTAIFHHYHYPNDLHGIVPYVAPISFGRADPRYETHLSNIGPAPGSCRTNLENIARSLVRERDALAALFAGQAPYHVFREDALASALVEAARGLTWSAWQYQGAELCSWVPTEPPQGERLAAWANMSTEHLAPQPYALEAYQYQVQRELGSPGYRASHLDDLLDGVSLRPLPPRVPYSWSDQRPTFDASSMHAVDQFLREDADNVVAIYGAWDPWSGGMITVDETRNSRVFTAPEQSHGAQIAHLSETDRAEALAMIQSMLGDTSTLNTFQTAGPSAELWTRAEEGHASYMRRLATTLGGSPHLP